MTELVGGGYERLQMQLMVANDQLKEKDKEIERLKAENKRLEQMLQHHTGWNEDRIRNQKP